MSRSVRPSRRAAGRKTSGSKKPAEKFSRRNYHATHPPKPPESPESNPEKHGGCIKSNLTLADIFGKGVQIYETDVSGQWAIDIEGQTVGAVVRHRSAIQRDNHGYQWEPLLVTLYRRDEDGFREMIGTLGLPDPRKLLIDSLGDHSPICADLYIGD